MIEKNTQKHIKILLNGELLDEYDDPNNISKYDEINLTPELFADILYFNRKWGKHLTDYIICPTINPPKSLDEWIRLYELALANPLKSDDEESISDSE